MAQFSWLRDRWNLALIAALGLSVLLALPQSENPSIHMESVAAFFPLASIVFFFLLYLVLKKITETSTATLFLFIAVFSTPLIWFLRTPSLEIFEVMMFLLAAYFFIQVRSKGIPALLFLLAVFLPMNRWVILMASFLFIAFVCHRLWKSSNQIRQQIAVLIVTFLIAFTSYHFVNWDSLFAEEYAGLQQGIESTTEHLADVATDEIFVIAPDDVVYPQLAFLDPRLKLFNETRFKSALSANDKVNKVTYVLAFDENYSQTLNTIQPLVYKNEWIQTIVWDASEWQFGMPMKRSEIGKKLTLIRASSSLVKL